MTPRNTSTGAVLEAMILPALERGGYAAVKQQTIGTRCGGGTHKVDAIATRGDDEILVSLKWQQTGGTAEQKVPFEVMCLADAVRAGRAVRAYIVLGGDGWTLRDYVCRVRHLVPSPPIEIAAAGLRNSSAPLLEEERYPRANALVPDFANPRRIDGAANRPALAADDDPVNAAERQVRDWAEQRLDRQESHSRRDALQVRDTAHVSAVLNRNALPDVFGPRQSVRDVPQSHSPLREYLKAVPVRPLHRREDAGDEGFRDGVVE